jgi:hypothetical protein
VKAGDALAIGRILLCLRDYALVVLDEFSGQPVNLSRLQKWQAHIAYNIGRPIPAELTPANDDRPSALIEGSHKDTLPAYFDKTIIKKAKNFRFNLHT